MTEDEIKEEFGKLSKWARTNKLEKVLSSCDVLLKALPGDPLVLQTKIVALARKGKFDEAEALAEEAATPETPASVLMPEGLRAYAAYRRGELPENVDESTTLGKHVSAQVAYKRGDYDKAQSIYVELEKETDDASAKGDILVNRLACMVSTLNANDSEAKDLVEKCLKYPAKNHQELYFNASLLAARRNDFARAREALETAAQHGANARDCEVHTAYLDAATGKLEEAKQRCKELLASLSSSSKPGDRAAVFAAANTFMAARKDDEDVYESHKRLKPFLSECQKGATKKTMKKAAAPLESQRRIFMLNWARLLFDMGKTDECHDVLKKELEDHKIFDLTTPDLICLMAASTKQDKTKKGKRPTAEEVADRVLKAAAANEIWQQSPQLASYAAEAHLQQSGDLKKAAEALNIKNATPGTASIRASMLEATGDLDAAKEALKGLDYSHEVCYSKNRMALAAHWLRLNEPQVAANILTPSKEELDASSQLSKAEQVEEAQRRSVATAARAVACCFFDKDKAQEALDELPPMPEDSDEEDSDDEELTEEKLEELLNKPPPRPRWAKARLRNNNNNDNQDQQKEPRPAKTKAAIQRRRDKRREAYLAKLREQKGDDPLPKPDPERWLPKKLRSYNKRGKKNTHKKMSGAQGVDATLNQKEIAKLDVAARIIKNNEDAGADVPATGPKKLPTGPPPKGPRNKGRKKR